MDNPIVFISYSHKNEEWKELVLTHLSVLNWLGIELWDDQRIGAGENWLPQIKQALDAASLALLLISKEFLNSPFIIETEVRHLFGRKVKDNLRIIPLILEPCAWSLGLPWLQGKQARPRGGRFLSEGDKNQIDRDLVALTIEIENELRSVSPTPPREFVHLPPERVAPSRLPNTGEHLLGREDELRILDEAWYDPSQHIISIVAFGGLGKTALVKHWLGRMSVDNYRGAECVFDWSFYSQGTNDTGASADQFIDTALRFFGDLDPTKGNPWDKGERLAALVAKSRTLLVLDGLEPLQYPGDPEPGQLNDPALAALIKGLALFNQGLCVITTRIGVSEIAYLKDTTAPLIKLDILSPENGAQLIAKLGVKGTDKSLQEVSVAFDGHALALTLLGNYLAKFRSGDVTDWREVPLLKDDQNQGRHARRVLRSYEKWMLGNSTWPQKLRKGLARTGLIRHWPNQGQLAWSLLRLMGYFNRPAKESEIKELLKSPPIKGLTESVVELDGESYQEISSYLLSHGLLMKVSYPISMDAHPLVREYLNEELRKRFPQAWKEGNRRLYEHLKGSSAELPKTPEEMTPYYQAIAHACFADRHRAAFNNVYMPYIRQGGSYNTDSLRAFGLDYGTLRSFLRDGRFKVVSELNDQSSFILGEIGFDLRALGRLDEAIEYMSAALAWDKAQKERDHRINAARQADILSTTYLIQGSVEKAIEVGDEAVDLAKSDDYHRMICLTTRADAKHRAGDLEGAENDFKAAESINKKIFSENEWVYLRSFQGFRYCDYLLTVGRPSEVKSRVEMALIWDQAGGYPTPKSSIRFHALQTEGSVLPLALDHLMFARLLLAENPGNQRGLEEAEDHMNKAIAGIRRSVTQHLLPRGLFVKAQWLLINGATSEAERTLTECLDICERYKLGLYKADCHFELALLYLERAKKRDPMDDIEQAQEEAKRATVELERAKEMSYQLGYGRLKQRIVRIEGDIVAGDFPREA